MQGHDQGDRSVQAQRGRSASGVGEEPEPVMDAGGEISELFAGQSGYTLQVQRLFCFVWLVSQPQISAEEPLLCGQNTETRPDRPFWLFRGATGPLL